VPHRAPLTPASLQFSDPTAGTAGTLVQVRCPTQCNGYDCGLYALAFARVLCARADEMPDDATALAIALAADPSLTPVPLLPLHVFNAPARTLPTRHLACGRRWSDGGRQPWGRHVASSAN
jgi:hypothetical protein